MTLLFFLFIFLLGLIFGSFVAAWVWREHHEISMWSGRSRCVACQYTLQVRDLIPVASFLLLKGKCRECQTSISQHYVLSEIVMGLLFLFLAFFYKASFFSVSLSFIFSLLVVLFFLGIFISDLLYQEIPFDMTLFPALLLFLFGIGTGISLWQDMLLGAIIAGGFFSLQYLVSKGKGIGFGDLGLALLMGVILGFEKTLLALALAYMGGALVGLLFLLCKKADKKTALPFGVFLTSMSFVAMLYGEKIIDWYLKLI